MKPKDLIRQLEAAGWVLVRHGGKHDWYHNPTTKISQPVPRHTEINEHLAKRILKCCAIPDWLYPIVEAAVHCSGRRSRFTSRRCRVRAARPAGGCGCSKFYFCRILSTPVEHERVLPLIAG